MTVLPRVSTSGYQADVTHFVTRQRPTKGFRHHVICDKTYKRPWYVSRHADRLDPPVHPWVALRMRSTTGIVSLFSFGASMFQGC